MHEKYYQVQSVPRILPNSKVLNFLHSEWRLLMSIHSRVGVHTLLYITKMSRNPKEKRREVWPTSMADQLATSMENTFFLFGFSPLDFIGKYI